MFRLHRPDVLPGRRSRHRDRGAEGLRAAQASDAGSAAEARRRVEAVSIDRLLVSLEKPRQSGRGVTASARSHQTKKRSRSEYACCRPPALSSSRSRSPASQQRARPRQREEVGRRRRSRPGDEARVRHVRRDVDERRRQSRRQAHRLRSARRHLHHVDRRQRRAPATRLDQRSGVRHAAALQS